MRLRWVFLGAPGHGPGGYALGTHWKGSWVDTCGFCAWWERILASSRSGVYSGTSGLAPGESPVPPYLYDHAYSGAIGTSREFLPQLPARF